MSPADDPLDTQSFTYVSVAQGAVGAEISLNTAAEWKPVPAGNNLAEGVVTSVAVAPGDEVTQGATLYSVGLRPVVVAAGQVPAFRVIGPKTKGPDVAQVQQMLSDLGLYGNVVDGEAGAVTIAAIKAWQKSLGVEPTGQIERGDVIFVAALPARIALDAEKVARGATLIGGESVLEGLPAAPLFTLPVTDAQAAMIPAGTRVEIASPEGDVWEGFAAGQLRDDETQTVSISLTGAADAVICGMACDQIPVSGETRLASQVVTVEQVEGLVIPTAALITNVDGQTAVIGADGARVPVTVTVSARGMSIIEGVAEGTLVQVPAEDSGVSG